jgi:hypothetical protein
MAGALLRYVESREQIYKTRGHPTYISHDTSSKLTMPIRALSIRAIPMPYLFGYLLKTEGNPLVSI